MPLFETHPVDRDAVAAAVKEHWGLELGDRIKASQNYTFKASRGEQAFAVRATPDPSGKAAGRIADECKFVTFLRSDSGLDCVCAPVPAEDGALVIRSGEIHIVVFPWAQGSSLSLLEWKWCTDESIVHAWGACFARLHAASRAFAAAHPDVASRMQSWTDVHEGVMRGSALAPEDAAVAAGGVGEHYGVLHGDLNLSNFFISEPEAEAGAGAASSATTCNGALSSAAAAAADSSASASAAATAAPAGLPLRPVHLSVYDWDQAQLGWWEWDLAQAALAVHMFAEGGMMGTHEPVPQVAPPVPSQFVDWLIAGYESVAGAGAVNRPRFWRMLSLRRAFYGRFTARAMAEGETPEDMRSFLKYVQGWLTRVPSPEGPVYCGAEGQAHPPGFPLPA